MQFGNLYVQTRTIALTFHYLCAVNHYVTWKIYGH